MADELRIYYCLTVAFVVAVNDVTITITTTLAAAALVITGATEADWSCSWSITVVTANILCLTVQLNTDNTAPDDVSN